MSCFLLKNISMIDVGVKLFVGVTWSCSRKRRGSIRGGGGVGSGPGIVQTTEWTYRTTPIMFRSSLSILP